ncbi:MAG: type II secretion system protein [Planctomycetota bacterium]
MKRHPRQSAFTIIELVVAIGLTSVLLFLVSRIFFETQQVLTFGIKTSNALAHARAIGTQLKTDADAMLGPSNAAGSERGFLVILNGTTNAIVKQPDGTEVIETIRTDQLVFLRGGGTSAAMFSLTPRRDSSLASDFSSPNAKVWYGHPRRANTDGTAGGGLGTGLDTFANDWVLGRQALLMAPADTATTPQNVVTAGAIYLNDAGLSGINAILNNAGGYPDGPTQTADFGFSDMTNLNLPDLANNLALPAATDADYLIQTYATRPLRVQTQIDTDVASFAAWQSAQTHPYLAAHISDFIVEFAADFDFDGEIDTTDDKGTSDTTDDDNTGGVGDPIFWVSGLNAGQVVPSIDPAGSPAWDAKVAVADLASAAFGDPGTLHAFVFRVDDDAAFTTAGTPYSRWPALIRIRYRIHDPQGRLSSFDDASGGPISGRFFEHILVVPRP